MTCLKYDADHRPNSSVIPSDPNRLAGLLGSLMGTDGEGTATELTENFNPITWRSTATYPSMRQWAFDTLSCPATSCECERVFSSTKKLITPERNKLQDDTIEALECLKAWFDKGLIESGDNVH